MKISLFALIFLAVFILINLYIAKRLVARLHFSKKIKNYLLIFVWVNFFGILLYLFARYEISTPSWLYFLLSLPVGVLFLLFVSALFYDLLLSLSNRIKLAKKRREFFKKSLDFLSLGGATLLSAGAIREAMHIEINRVPIAIEGIGSSYRIVQISDLHIGGLIDASFVKDIVAKVNEEKPDVVALTGDIIDTDIEYIAEALDALKRLEARYGVYFVLGNHEYFHNPYRAIEAVTKLGFDVLQNENRYIGKKGEGFNLLGVHDVMGGRFGMLEPDLQKAKVGVDEDSPSILLAHQPRYVGRVSGIDLMLSGHTHGGQIFPFGALVRLQQPYLRGLYRHDERLQVFVSKGSGFWGPPMRLFAQSEISVLDIS